MLGLLLPLPRRLQRIQAAILLAPTGTLQAYRAHRHPALQPLLTVALLGHGRSR